MAQPSLQDFAITQDLSNVAGVEGVQLNQILTTGIPFTDKGMIVETIDDGAGNPNVPDPTQAPAYAKWNLYLWRRVSPLTATVNFYYWNPNAGSIPTYAQWQPLFSGSIPNGSITGNMIALATSGNGVTDANIVSLSAAKISGSVPASGVAGGGLAGAYPNPTVALNSLTAANMMTVDATNLTDANIKSIAQVGGGLNLVGASGKAQLGGASQILAMNAGATAWTYLTDYFALLSQASGLGGHGAIAQVNAGATALSWLALGTALQNLRVNAGGTALEYYTPPTFASNPSGTDFNSNAYTLPFGLGASAFELYKQAHGLGVVPTKIRAVLQVMGNDATSAYTAGMEIDARSVFYYGKASTAVQPIFIGLYADTTYVYGTLNILGSCTASPPAVSSTGWTTYMVDKTGITLCTPTSWSNFAFKFYCQP